MLRQRIQCRRRFLISSSIIASIALGAAACSSSASTSTGTSAGAAKTSASVISQELAGKVPPTAKEELDQNIPLTAGQAIPGYPNGAPPSSADMFHFTSAEIAKLKAGHYTAAIALHLSNSAWSGLQIKGITTTLAKFGIKVVATTSANGVASTQVSQLATLIARKPTAMFSIAVNPTSEATEYKQIEANGIKLILLDNVPPGMTPSQNYVTDVSANNGGNGLFAAEQLYKAIGCAPIGVIGLDYFFPVVNVRITDALKYLSEKCPHQVQYTKNLSSLVVTPAFTYASAMIAQHPDIKGFFAGWNSIAEEIVGAEKSAGVKLPIATTDIGPVSTLDLAEGYIVASGGQEPYQQGVAEADALAYNLLGMKVPPFIELPTVPVSLADIIPAYKIVNGTNPPADDIAAITAAGG
ncbi:MAG: substrate-binding domain-containing protein [Streptosporangiaceae bacterium]